LDPHTVILETVLGSRNPFTIPHPTLRINEQSTIKKLPKV